MDMFLGEIIVVALLVSLSCALSGLFLVLRGIALMTDAMSHAIVLGIVIMFLWIQSLDSFWLMCGAALIGLVMVFITEYIIQTNYLKKDAALGIVFPLFFSLGIILMSKYGRSIHLDVDMVLLGEIAFTPLRRCIIQGVDCGPLHAWFMAGILLLNGLGIALFYKQLVVATFDPLFATMIGMVPTVFFYGLMAMTSVTVVGAFDSVGSVVVVALMIAPAAGAYLLSQTIAHMIGFSCLIAIVTAVSGCIVAYDASVSIIGSIATMAGMVFLMIIVLAPDKGIIASWMHVRRSRNMLALRILCSYIRSHSRYRLCASTIARCLGWTETYTQRLIFRALKGGLLEQQGDVLILTAQGDSYFLRFMPK